MYNVLPDDWKGSFLVIVFVLSSFLDNIAGAMIGGAMAHSLFKHVQIGYLAAIVAASNAGGAGSVIGDTTTTMMWIDGVAPAHVLHAYVASGVALLVFGTPAAWQQHAHSPITAGVRHQPRIDWVRVAIVFAMLVAAIGAKCRRQRRLSGLRRSLPFIGVAVWLTILASIPSRRPDWELLGEAPRGAVFLLALVLAASMVPVGQLPAPSWQTALGLGFVSAIIDNLPLTKLALDHGAYDGGCVRAVSAVAVR